MLIFLHLIVFNIYDKRADPYFIYTYTWVVYDVTRNFTSVTITHISSISDQIFASPDNLLMKNNYVKTIMSRVIGLLDIWGSYVSLLRR